jgi:hypothetical protein
MPLLTWPIDRMLTPYANEAKQMKETKLPGPAPLRLPKPERSRQKEIRRVAKAARSGRVR